MQPSSNIVPVAESVILARLEKLERQNRRLKIVGGALLAAIGVGAVAGFQAPPGKRISADEISCGTIRAETFTVSNDRATITLDKNGLVISAKGLPTGGRTNLVDHESRIEIGLDWDWEQENALKPTPRVLVGRVGHDTSDNLSTRASLLSPEGCHSGQWHKNNPRHDGRTDRELIDSMRR